MNNIYIEYGLDFDNNRFGLGKSIEVEEKNGSEYRVKKDIAIQNKRYYFRIWIFKKVLIISSKGFEIITKKRHNFKIIFGISGIQKQDI